MCQLEYFDEKLKRKGKFRKKKMTMIQVLHNGLNIKKYRYVY